MISTVCDGGTGNACQTAVTNLGLSTACTTAATGTDASVTQQKLVTNVTYSSTMNMIVHILYKTNAKLNTLWQQKLSMI